MSSNRMSLDEVPHDTHDVAAPGSVAGVRSATVVSGRKPDAPLLLERENELGTIVSMLRAVREGLSATLVIRGEPGVGKTALLDHAASSAGELAVTRVTGVESEMQLGFAGLHRLLIPLLARLERLPVPQRRAVQSAFGLLKADPPDRFLVGLAVLNLLDDAAAQRPLLVVVDDAQWLDRESLAALAFVARRLHADRVAMLFATADHSRATAALDALPGLDLAGLSCDATAELLRTLAGQSVDGRVAQRVAAETRGNPLAIVELAGELSATQLVGACALPEPLPVGARLEERFLRRVRELPDEVQALLLLAAVASPLDRSLLRSAATEAGIDPDEVVELGAGKFLLVDDEVRFRHPLMRSAIYSGATGAERRHAHEVLAVVSDAAGDSTRAAWYHAAAADGPDEGTAAELDRAAERARARGGYEATAALLARAAELTPDLSRRAERLLRTAQAKLAAGAPDAAQANLDEAAGQLTDARQRAEARRTQGAIEFARGRGVDAPATLLAAASQLAPLDLRLARVTLLEALEAAQWAGRFAKGGGPREIAAAARDLPRALERAAGVDDLLLDAFAARADLDYEASVPLMREAIAGLRQSALAVEDGVRWLGLGCYAAGELFDEESWGAFAARWVELTRAAGALTMLPLALAEIANVETHAGRFIQADTALAESREIAIATDNPGVLGATAPHYLLPPAWRGEAEKTRASAERVVGEATARGQGQVVSFARSALVVLELGLGECEAALAAGLPVYEDDPPYLGTRVLPDLIEAATRCERTDIAQAALTCLSERARASASELALGLLARSRALLSDDGAHALYSEALERLARTRARPELGRTHLLFGEWLRRQRRRRDARAQLRLAHGLFESLGARGFAERAAAELLATGERARKRDDTTRDELTPQEARIAKLAAEGASNSEIAETLFISSSTVAYHLRKVFRKLNVSSRAKLRRALSDAQPNGEGDQIETFEHNAVCDAHRPTAAHGSVPAREQRDRVPGPGGGELAASRLPVPNGSCRGAALIDELNRTRASRRPAASPRRS